MTSMLLKAQNRTLSDSITLGRQVDREKKTESAHQLVTKTEFRGAIHSTKIPTGPTGKRGPPQKMDPFFRNFSGWTEPIH